MVWEIYKSNAEEGYKRRRSQFIYQIYGLGGVTALLVYVQDIIVKGNDETENAAVKSCPALPSNSN